MTLDQVKAEKARRSLSEYIKQAWPTLEPETTYKHNWHVDAIAEHLQAVSRGQISKLLINVPPGHMKSLSVCVFWPSWHWIHQPHYRWLFASYSSHLSIRDATKMRMLINSSWYQEHFGHRFQLTKETEQYVANDKLGFRIATSVGGVGTGERVHVVVNDDLMRANDAESPAMREQALKHMRAMSTRAVDPSTFSQVLIMQRVHEDDPAGWVMEQGGWEQLILPAEYEPERRCVTSIGFEDPRKQEGELLWPDMFGQKEIEDLKNALGPLDAAAQLQQRAAPAEGLLIKPDLIRILDVLPPLVREARGWDLAATTEAENKKADWTAGARLGRDADGRFYIGDMRRLRGTPHQVELALTGTAALDGTDVAISGPQDPGQAGKAQGISLTKLLAGYDVEFTPETGSKSTRAKAFAAQVEAGNVFMLRADWNKALIDELRVFPNGRHDDQVDAISRAFHRLIFGSTWAF